MLYGISSSYKCVHFQKFIYKVFVSNLFPIDNFVHKYCFLGVSYENVELKYSISGLGFNNCIKQYMCYKAYISEKENANKFFFLTAFTAVSDVMGKGKLGKDYKMEGNI